MQTTRTASHPHETDVAVVGGGLAGLTAATLLARTGRHVMLFEKSHTLGGRAVTHVHGDFRFNLGPHALYRSGPGIEVLRALGIRFSGGTPPVAGAYAIDGGVKHTLPGGFVSLLTTGLLRLPAKFELARLLGAVQKIDAQAIQDLTVREWLAGAIRHPDVRRLVQALLRLSTYANDPERQSAGAALAQLQLALSSGVTYLDGGWQVLVDGLRDAARTAGVQILSGTRVTAIEHDRILRGVRLADDTRIAVSNVVIAAAPSDAVAVLPESVVLREWNAAAIPIKAACLDVALSRLPQPRATFALGIDQPLYLSVHSAVAKLAAPGGATIHVAKYLPAGRPTDAKADERELEATLDLVQPGWRDVVVERRYLPSMIVSHALVTAAAGGIAGRPSPAVPDVAGAYVVGDWVGRDGMLADASLASAKQAATLIMQRDARHAAAA